MTRISDVKIMIGMMTLVIMIAAMSGGNKWGNAENVLPQPHADTTACLPRFRKPFGPSYLRFFLSASRRTLFARVIWKSVSNVRFESPRSNSE